MKKTLCLLTSVILTLALIATGCKEKVTETEEEPVKNNLPEPRGANELAGNTYSDENATYEFRTDTVKVTEKSETSIPSIPLLQLEQDGMVYNYSYDSEAGTLSLQLKHVVENGKVKSYEQELEEAQKDYDDAAEQISDAFADDSVYTGLESYGEATKKLAKEYVSKTISEYLENQKSLVNDYIEAKYNNVVTLAYTLTDSGLSLVQQYGGSLSDVSAKFVTDETTAEYSVSLNDYQNLAPFFISAGESSWSGVPQISSPEETTGTLTAELSEASETPDFSDTDETTAFLTQRISEISASIVSLMESLQDSANLIKLLSGDTSVLESSFGTPVSAGTFEADYTLDAANLAQPVLTLTVKSVPQALSEVFSKDMQIVMRYKPEINAQLEKQ